MHDNDIVHHNLTSVSIIHPVHRDPLNLICKQNNVLIAADGSPRLADFGISNSFRDSGDTISIPPSLYRWTAPEFFYDTYGMTLLEDISLLEKKTFLRDIMSGDIYSLGCIILEVMSLIDLLTLIDTTCRFYIGKCPIGGPRIFM